MRGVVGWITAALWAAGVVVQTGLVYVVAASQHGPGHLTALLLLVPVTAAAAASCVRLPIASGRETSPRLAFLRGVAWFSLAVTGVLLVAIVVLSYPWEAWVLPTFLAYAASGVPGAAAAVTVAVVCRPQGRAPSSRAARAVVCTLLGGVVLAALLVPIVAVPR